MIFDVIVIGAGLSGSFLASKLKDQGKRVLIIEKSRGVGGRCSTKPIEKNIVDYGCQYFKPKSNSAINILNIAVRVRNSVNSLSVLNTKTFIQPRFITLRRVYNL